MDHLGFPRIWVQWVKSIIDTGTTSVLLNRVPDKEIHHRRGVRQGDPLSPLLFVLVADLLQCIINKAHSLNLLNLPILSRDGSGFLIIQYAYDTVVVLETSQHQLFFKKLF
jgi:hypothetical protein